MVKIKLPKGLPSFSFRKDTVAKILNDMADTAVKTMVNETEQGKDIQGKNFTRLKASTVKSKRKKGYRNPSKPLIATGLMKNIFKSKKATTQSLSSEVKVAKKRKDIAEYHIDGAGSLPKRVFFGVGKTLEGKLKKIIKLRLEKLIKVVFNKVRAK